MYSPPWGGCWYWSSILKCDTRPGCALIPVGEAGELVPFVGVQIDRNGAGCGVAGRRHDLSLVAGTRIAQRQAAHDPPGGHVAPVARPAEHPHAHPLAPPPLHDPPRGPA